MSRDNPHDELVPIAAFLPGLELGGGLKVPNGKKPGLGQSKALVTPIERRLIEAAAPADDQTILYQHTVFCQTGLPYKDQGAERTWRRNNGMARLLVEAGNVLDPKTAEFVQVGLPFGPKPRLILCHINTEALLTASPEIDAQRTITRFVSHGLRLDTNGRNMRVIKDQLTRLSACRILLGMVKDGRSDQVNSQIVSSFSVWLEKDERQRVLWPQRINLDPVYFASLQAHAVPLNDNHLAALAHSAMALDVYAWLAQRLHRIPKGRASFLPWTAVEQQFGGGYSRIRAFRNEFLGALKQVKVPYSQARVEPGRGGLSLWNSPPPVPPKLFPTYLGQSRSAR